MKDLETCRSEIDDIDQQMLQLFEKRMGLSKQVVEYKLAHNMEIFQSNRETEVINETISQLQNDNLKEYAKNYIQDLMNISKSYQASFIPVEDKIELKEPKKDHLRVGFQGVPGAFSELALRIYFGEEAVRKHYTKFEDVYDALNNDEIDYGIVPLENSSTGAINDNYDCIRDYGFYIVGEQHIRVSQHLLGIKGATLEDITDVYSHPQGLLQTSQYLQAHHITPHEYTDTAEAAKYIAERNDKHLGAIASIHAAQLYNLDVIGENIEDVKTNSTRFIVFSKYLERVEGANCVSIVFTTKHQVGALYQVIKIINDHQINMVRIESRPVRHTPWEYYFYVDFEGSLDDYSIIQVLERMKAHTNTLRILGHYVR